MVSVNQLPLQAAMTRAAIRENFWRTAKKAARQVPFMEEVVAAYYCALDKEHAAARQGILLAALGYFILPADTIPDVDLRAWASPTTSPC